MPGLGTRALAECWSAAATLLAPALRIYLRQRAARGREIVQRLPERFGMEETPRPAGRLVWMHAASVGEMMSVLPVLDALRDRANVLLTTGTVTSQRLLAQRLPELGLADHVLHRFAPLDVPAWVDRFLAHWRPDTVCFVESELWPNQIAACQSMRIPMVLLNARMSETAFRRWLCLPGLARHVLGGFARVLARSDLDAERLAALGARCVERLGDLKLAAPPLAAPESELQALCRLFADRPVWLAASTHPGEESMIAATHRTVAATHPALLTIIVPRHPDRGVALASELRAPRRGAGQPPPNGSGIWIADTLGELGLWFRLAPIVFMGRSLVAPGGGQNPLEPARLGCAIALGPFTDNFADHVALLRDANAVVDVRDAEELAQFVGAMLDDPERRRCLGKRAAAAIRRHQDAPERAAEVLLSLLPQC